MTEYWKSQARKFCDFCKCWIADNKASISFHENGKKHQQAVENRLYEIKRKGKKDDLKARKEEEWMKEIERKAMNDYRTKDVGNNADITAKIFNQKRQELYSRDDDPTSDKAMVAAQLAAMDESMDKAGKPGTSKSSIGPSIGPQIEVPDAFKEVAGVASDKWDGTSTAEISVHKNAPNLFKKVSAPTSGTKWHNEPGDKKWYEAKTDEGHTYYWHLETHESSWNPPAEGYMSIHQQKVIAEQKELKEKLKAEKAEKRKQEIIEEQRSIHGRNLESEVYEGPVQKASPYGSWKLVENTDHLPEAPVDYQVPTVKAGPTANVTLHSDRLTKFEEKTTPSLGGSNSSETSTKPAIVFRKRKINDDHRKHARRREDE